MNKFFVYTISAQFNHPNGIGVQSTCGCMVTKSQQEAEVEVLASAKIRYPNHNGYFNHQYLVEEFDFNQIAQQMQA